MIIIDICTFALTIFCIASVRKSQKSARKKKDESFIESFKEGFMAITQKRGLIVLIAVSAVMTCFMGAIQILVEPMILDFQTSKVLGITETVCASGMLVSSMIIGVKGLKKNFSRILSFSLMLCGICMIGFGSREDIYVICIFGFMFFFMLPFANNCLDYLTRINIDPSKQGRAWGLISFLSQLGYVFAYAFAGILADRIAIARNIGVGRGAAIVIMISGVMLSLSALMLLRFKSVKELEKGENNVKETDI